MEEIAPITPADRAVRRPLRPFRFGVVAAGARSGEEWTAKARRAEELGFAVLVVPDGLRHTLGPLPALALAAAATRTLRVGTYVLANDFRNPVQLAKDVATLDFLTGGRVELGIGAGRVGSDVDNRSLGVPFDSGAVRVARLGEALALLKGVLAGARPSASGAYYRASDAEISPGPAQRPHPPVLVAGGGPQILALAAREADIVAFSLPPDAPEAALAEKIDRLRGDAGDRFAGIELNINLLAVGNRVPRYVADQLRLSAEELGRRGAVAALPGTVDEMCDRLLARRERLGVSYLMVSDELMEAMAPVVQRLAGR